MASTSNVLGKGKMTESVAIGLREALILVARSFPGMSVLEVIPMLSWWRAYGHRVIQPWQSSCLRCMHGSPINCPNGTKVVELFADYSFRNGAEVTLVMTQTLHGSTKPADPWEGKQAFVTVLGRKAEYIASNRDWIFVEAFPYSSR